MSKDYQKIIIQNARSLGTDLLEADYPSPCDAKTAIYRGRIYSISGKDKRFPKLPADIFSTEICLYPFLYGISEPTICKKGNEIKQSNRPFIDDRSESEKKAFEGSRKISSLNSDIHVSDPKHQKRKKVRVPIGEHPTVLSERIIDTIMYMILFAISFFVLVWAFSLWRRAGWVLIILCFMILIIMIVDTWKRKTTIEYKQVYEDELTEDDKEMIAKYKK